jgi:hypothetical protein
VGSSKVQPQLLHCSRAPGVPRPLGRTCSCSRVQSEQASSFGTAAQGRPLQAASHTGVPGAPREPRPHSARHPKRRVRHAAAGPARGVSQARLRGLGAAMESSFHALPSCNAPRPSARIWSMQHAWGRRAAGWYVCASGVSRLQDWHPGSWGRTRVWDQAYCNCGASGGQMPRLKHFRCTARQPQAVLGGQTCALG